MSGRVFAPAELAEIDRDLARSSGRVAQLVYRYEPVPAGLLGLSK